VKIATSQPDKLQAIEFCVFFFTESPPSVLQRAAQPMKPCLNIMQLTTANYTAKEIKLINKNSQISPLCCRAGVFDG